MDTLNLAMWYALVAIALVYFFSGLDDIFADLIYWCRFIYSKIRISRSPKLTYHDLQMKQEQNIAILIPCWQEFDVIERMLRYNLTHIDYLNYTIFVGVYPNDHKTLEIVEKLQNEYPQVKCIIGKDDGPTNKARNLNFVFQYILNYEKEHDVHYDIFLLHDSEDVIHPLSFKLYNYLMPKKSMIQLPIFPLPVSHLNWTHWVYADEFAEMHTKELVARETFYSFVPSAGVGTALTRESMFMLAEENNGVPLHTDTLTEDYDLSFRLQLKKKNVIFLTQHIDRVVKKRCWWKFFRKSYVTKKEFIATRSLFPVRYSAAIKQRSRWIVGISLQGWQKMGWTGGFGTKYFLFHDRKAILTFFLVGLGYIVFAYWLIIYFWNFIDPSVRTVVYYFSRDFWVYLLIIACTILMVERLLQGFIATTRVYGIIAGILSVPRTVWGNIIFTHSFFKALILFYADQKKQKAKAKKSKAQTHKNTSKETAESDNAPAWNKTRNTFPDEETLQALEIKLGDFLIQTEAINATTLNKALERQEITGKKLGEILTCDTTDISTQQLFYALAKKHQLTIIRFNESKILPKEKIKCISQTDYDFLIKNKLFPIQCHNSDILLVITDPSDLKLMETVKTRCLPNRVRFVLGIRGTCEVKE